MNSPRLNSLCKIRRRPGVDGPRYHSPNSTDFLRVAQKDTDVGHNHEFISGEDSPGGLPGVYEQRQSRTSANPQNLYSAGRHFSRQSKLVLQHDSEGLSTTSERGMPCFRMSREQDGFGRLRPRWIRPGFPFPNSSSLVPGI